MAATTIPSSKPSLTSNDAAVLQALFDAESAPSAAVTIDPSLPAYPSTSTLSASDLESLQARELAIVRPLTATVSRRTLTSAIAELDALIAANPTYPPAYANRAQAYRLLVEQSRTHEPGPRRDAQELEGSQQQRTPEPEDQEDALFVAAENAESASRLFADLGQAIALATPKAPADPLSVAQARLLADAHTHRGYLLLRAARVAKSRKAALDAGSGSAAGPERLRGLSADELEEMASRDFYFGGRLGNRVAQQLAVQTNPYAKMCGAIVKEALKKEVLGGNGASAALQARGQGD